MLPQRVVTPWLTPIFVLFLGGCYHYIPATPDELAPAQDIRARVSLTQAEALEEILQRDNPRVINGTVVERSGESVVVDVPVTTDLQGDRLRTLRQRVTLPLNSIQELERRELARGRTYALVGASTALIAMAITGWVIQSEGGVGEELPPGEEHRGPFHIPIWSW